MVKKDFWDSANRGIYLVATIAVVFAVLVSLNQTEQPLSAPAELCGDGICSRPENQGTAKISSVFSNEELEFKINEGESFTVLGTTLPKKVLRELLPAETYKDSKGNNDNDEYYVQELDFVPGGISFDGTNLRFYDGVEAYVYRLTFNTGPKYDVTSPKDLSEDFELTELNILGSAWQFQKASSQALPNGPDELVLIGGEPFSIRETLFTGETKSFFRQGEFYSVGVTVFSDSVNFVVNGESVTLAIGKTYSLNEGVDLELVDIATSTKETVADSARFYLGGSEKAIIQGDGSSNFLFSGKEYEIFNEITTGESTLTINGEKLSISEGKIHTLQDGTVIGITEIATSSKETVANQASIVFGSKVLTLRDGREVVINGDNFEGSFVRITNDVANNRLKEIKISYFSQGDMSLGEGDSWNDPIFGRFGFSLENVETLSGEDSKNCPEDCEVSPSKECIDSDGGKDYYAKGITTGYYNNFEAYGSLEDVCCQSEDGSLCPSHALSGLPGVNLVEKYCEKEEIKESRYYCPKGCQDGTCLGEPSEEELESPEEEIKIPKEEAPEEEQPKEDVGRFICQGCFSEGTCYPIGYRLDESFCDSSKSFAPQLNEDFVCNNNFECSSNFCISGKCVDQGLLNQIIEWFRNLFG